MHLSWLRMRVPGYLIIYQDGWVTITYNRSDATILKLLGLKSRLLPFSLYKHFIVSLINGRELWGVMIIN